MAERRDEFHQPLRRISCPAPCDLFHKPPAQQEKQQHGDGFEIHPLPRIDGKAVNARDKGHHDRNRNRRIHADSAVFPIAPCAAVKRQRAVKHDGQYHQKAAPVQDFQKQRLNVAAVKIRRHGKHHRLHHAQTRDRQPDDKLFALFLRLRLDFLRIIRRGGITRFADFQKNVRQRDFALVPHHAAAVRTVIQIHAHHARRPQKLLLNQPYARRASNAAQHQHRLAFIPFPDLDKIRLHFGQIVQFQLRQHFRRRQFGFFRVGGTLFVIIAQTCINNALRHRLTTRAAGFMVFIFVADGQMEVFGDFQTAMETGSFRLIHNMCLMVCRQMVCRLKLGFEMFKNVNFIKVSLFSRFLKIFYKTFILKQFAYFYIIYLYFSMIYPFINRRTVAIPYRISVKFTDYFNVKKELF